MVIRYEDNYEKTWDEFVLNSSINGNFLQTRNFLNYHKKGRFSDASVLIMKDDKIAAVIPANETDYGKTLIAHEGSTYGGLIVGYDFANTSGYKWIFEEMLRYFNEKQYETVELRMHSNLYSPCDKQNELLNYFFQLNGFSVRNEIGFFVDLSLVDEDFEKSFEKLKRRKLNKAKKNELEFKRIGSDEDVTEYYRILEDNMIKFDTVPTHTLDEILDLKNNRLKDEMAFYGVYLGDRMIAGSMVFIFCEKKVFHTQYLASLHDYLDQCPNEFLYDRLIRTAAADGFRYLSFGTASLDHGKIYNESLGMYKEGFNTDSYMNPCYIWKKTK